MNAKQQLLCGCLIAAAVSAGWIHGSAGYADWKAVAADAPCNTFEKDGRDVKVIGPITVDGKTVEHHVITDEKRVKEIEDRCPLKHG
jgi:hypothetical protein